MGKGDPSDPTWRYISQALARARAYAGALGHTLTGDSCFFVSGLALGLVMQTRNRFTSWTAGDGGPTLATDNPLCIELAYADHYLNMRSSTGMTSYAGYVGNVVAAAGYDALKQPIFAMKGISREPFPEIIPNPQNPGSLMPDSVKLVQMLRSLFTSAVGGTGDAFARALQENPDAPLSAPTPESRYWANQGNQDGIQDFSACTLAGEKQAVADYKRTKGIR